MKAEKRHLSAAAPVGIVAVVSMKTIWNRKSANAAESYPAPWRRKPFHPSSPQSCPNRCRVISWFSPA